jgi:ribosome-associated protein
MATNTAKKKLENINTDASKQVAKICANAASDKKATNVVVLDVHELTAVADYFVVASAPSDRQVQAIVRNVEDSLRDQGVRATSVEGLKTSSWVLLDFGDVIFHCFTESAREYYDLEGFWIDAPRIDWE